MLRPMSQRDPPRPWLSIVGIGEDGVAGLGSKAREAIQSAAVVFGGARHLGLAAPLIRGTPQSWVSPFEDNLPKVLAHRGQAVCVLASGDPFMHGIGTLLARHVPREEAVAIPSPSAFSLAASRLHWPLHEVALLSLCGRPTDLVRAHLQPGARLLALSADGSTPAAVAALLSDSGCGQSEITVLEALGGPGERVRTARADAFSLDGIAPLNILAVEVVAGPQARILPRAAGLPDDLFEHDGQITKREIRALTLAALAPRRGEHLWDIGAGSGSIAIEWLLCDSSLTAIAIEQRADRAARIRRNAAACGVPSLQVIAASAPQCLAGLPIPGAIFVGGGATTPLLLEAACAALRPQGRLVANAVSLESEAILLRHYAERGGNLLRVSLARSGSLGPEMSGWRPARPVTQWTWVKS
jgi:precorrin-6B C5,15-methyltransferase / cobalt-precorrin-6B C5,C15-methyltransferase